MKNLDRQSSLFWLLVSVFLMVEAWRLGVGSVQKPGAGFIAFGTAGLLGILSLALFLQAGSKAADRTPNPPATGAGLRIALVLIALLLYAWLLSRAGYLIGTAALMFFLFWVVDRRRLAWPLVFSLAATLVTYFLFSRLGCSFPAGLFDF